jgi:hypothetical protein
MYDIIIFGGGIAGLTIAHELIKQNFKILIVEKENEIGGMARSIRINKTDNMKYGIPSEHSWRGYAPFYKNCFEIQKQIPYNKKTVYDNLSKPIEFYLLKDKIANYKSNISFYDYFYLTYLGLKYFLSNNRREYYNSYLIEPLLCNNLSRDGYNYITKHIIGPGLGMQKEDCSYGHLSHVPLLSLLGENYTHKHDNEHNNYIHHSYEGWHVMNGPTNERWFDPWIKYLKNKGVEIIYNTELIKLNKNKNKIFSSLVKNDHNKFILKAKNFIISTNPFNAEKVFYNSNIENLYRQFNLLNKNTKSKQISFRIGFNQKIKYPIKNISFVMLDSEFNITWYPQEKHWNDVSHYYDSLWSGTIINFRNKGKLFRKSAEKLNNIQLKDEIVYQILRSKSFQKLIFEQNKFVLKKKDIEYIEIWPEWNYNNGVQKQKNKKWVNNIYNEKFRPKSLTKFDNLFLSGSHIKNSVKIWSMEGAIESGKITANNILSKYDLPLCYKFIHDNSFMSNFFRFFDDILYYIYLPNLLDLFLIIIFFLFFF